MLLRVYLPLLALIVLMAAVTFLLEYLKRERRRERQRYEWRERGAPASLPPLGSASPAPDAPDALEPPEPPYGDELPDEPPEPPEPPESPDEPLVFDYRRRPLLSRGELAFYRALRQAAGDSLVVFAKVKLDDLVWPAGRLTRSDFTKAWNRVRQKHVDFVLCEPQSLAVRLVVELDDASHTPGHRHYRAGRDATVDAALTSAGLPILRVKAASRYEVGSLREAIGSKLG